MIQLHLDATGSPRAQAIVDDWENTSLSFKRIAPVAEVARLEALFEGTTDTPIEDEETASEPTP